MQASDLAALKAISLSKTGLPFPISAEALRSRTQGDADYCLEVEFKPLEATSRFVLRLAKAG
jgi:hypothetical protein